MTPDSVEQDISISFSKSEGNSDYSVTVKPAITFDEFKAGTEHYGKTLSKKKGSEWSLGQSGPRLEESHPEQAEQIESFLKAADEVWTYEYRTEGSRGSVRMYAWAKNHSISDEMSYSFD